MAWLQALCITIILGVIRRRRIIRKTLRLPPWLGWPLWNICVTNDHGYVPLVVSTSGSFSHSRLINAFVTRLTWQVSLVEKELLTLPEHLSSPPVFSGGSCYSIFSFMCMLCTSLLALLYFFFWPLFCLFFFDIRILITLRHLQTLHKESCMQIALGSSVDKKMPKILGIPYTFDRIINRRYICFRIFVGTDMEAFEELL